MMRQRLFQTGFLISLYLFILTPPQELYQGWDTVLSLAAIALFATLHFLIERSTWQLYTSYCTVPLLFILYFYHCASSLLVEENEQTCSTTQRAGSSCSYEWWALWGSLCLSWPP